MEKTPLIIACEKLNFPIVKKIVESIDANFRREKYEYINHFDNHGNTAYMTTFQIFIKKNKHLQFSTPNNQTSSTPNIQDSTKNNKTSNQDFIPHLNINTLNLQSSTSNIRPSTSRTNILKLLSAVALENVSSTGTVENVSSTSFEKILEQKLKILNDTIKKSQLLLNETRTKSKQQQQQHLTIKNIKISKNVIIFIGIIKDCFIFFLIFQVKNNL